MRRIRKPDARHRVMILNMIIWVALTWFLTGVYFHTAETHYIHRVAKEARLEAQLAESYLKRHLEPLQIIPDIIARIPDISVPLNAINKQEKIVSGSNQKISVPAETILRQLSAIIRKSEVRDVVLLDADNHCIGVIGFDAAARAYCNGSQQNRLIFPPESRDNVWYWAWFGPPGLYHSAPIIIDGKPHGLLIGKIDINGVFEALKNPNTFVADQRGVITLARTEDFLMRALPHATVQKMPAQARMAEYGRKTFPEIHIKKLKDLPQASLIQWGGQSLPSIMVSYQISKSGVTLYLTRDLKNLPVYRQWRYASFVLMSILGCLVVWQGYSLWHAYQRAKRHFREMQRQHQLMKEQVYTDELTGVTNRRYFFTYAEHVRSQAIYRGRTFCLMYIDFDKFKQINDSYGHDYGDEVLRQVSIHIRSLLRSGDVLSRLGGDEFVVTMPETGFDEAIQAGERICSHIGGVPYQILTREIPITLSIGITDWHQLESESIPDCCNRADRALYAAKAAGRNLVRGIRAGEVPAEG